MVNWAHTLRIFSACGSDTSASAALGGGVRQQPFTSWRSPDTHSTWSPHHNWVRLFPQWKVSESDVNCRCLVLFVCALAYACVLTRVLYSFHMHSQTITIPPHLATCMARHAKARKKLLWPVRLSLLDIPTLSLAWMLAMNNHTGSPWLKTTRKAQNFCY